MATQTLYIAVGGPPPSLADLGPGAGGGAGVIGMGTVLGQTVTIGTVSNPAATFELRVVINSGAQNVNTELSAQNVFTNLQMYQECEVLRRLSRNHGFVLGSGGPGLNAGSATTPFLRAAETIQFPV